MLVVATPCPLILAVPVALVAGMSKAARTGILIKGASALEALAAITVVVFDKTGTLTTGEPTVTRIETSLDPDELLALAASLDQASAHTIGRTIVEEAKKRGLRLSKPITVKEVPGEGIEGFVGNRKVAVGGWNFIAAKTKLVARPLGSARRSAMSVMWQSTEHVPVQLSLRIRYETTPRQRLTAFDSRVSSASLLPPATGWKSLVQSVKFFVLML